MLLVNPLAGIVTSPYDEDRVHPVHGYPIPHYGTDLGGRPRGGTHTIHAPADGRVHAVRTDSYPGDPRPGYLPRLTGNGGVLDIAGARVYLGHLDKVLVKPGDKVTAGDVLGTQGATGVVDGAHVHLEVWIDGYAVDPEPYFRARGVRLGTDPTTPPEDDDMPLTDDDLDRIAARVWRYPIRRTRTAAQLLDRNNHAGGRIENAYRAILTALKITK